MQKTKFILVNNASLRYLALVSYLLPNLVSNRSKDFWTNLTYFVFFHFQNWSENLYFQVSANGSILYGLLLIRSLYIKWFFSARKVFDCNHYFVKLELAIWFILFWMSIEVGKIISNDQFAENWTDFYICTLTVSSNITYKLPKKYYLLTLENTRLRVISK